MTTGCHAEGRWPAQAQQLVGSPCKFSAGVLWVHCGIKCTDDSAIAEMQKELFQSTSAKVREFAAVQWGRLSSCPQTVWGSFASTHSTHSELCNQGGYQAVTSGDMASALHAELRGKDYLIVLDDVWDSKIVSAFQFPGFCGKLLVTTRDPNLCATNAEVVKICPSDCREVVEPLLARLAFRGAFEARSLPAEYRVCLQMCHALFPDYSLGMRLRVIVL